MSVNREQPLPRSKLKWRTLRFAIATSAACALAYVWIEGLRQNLLPAAFYSGYLMLGALCFLAAFHLRKRLSMLPWLGTASFWMQLHIWVGFASLFLFGLHIQWRVPGGWLEGTLATVYLLVVASGVYGLYVTRTTPRKLRSVDADVPYQQIPQVQRQLAVEARELIARCTDQTRFITRFYLRLLVPWFERPRHWTYAVCPTGHRRRKLIGATRDLDRYLNRDQRQLPDQLIRLIQHKDDLDFLQAMLARLKVWMLVHVGLIYGLLILAVVHGVAAHGFFGGLP